MSEELQSKLPNADMQSAPRALLRAARRAREIARQTNTAIVIVRDGELVEETVTADDLRDFPPTPDTIPWRSTRSLATDVEKPNAGRLNLRAGPLGNGIRSAAFKTGASRERWSIEAGADLGQGRFSEQSRRIPISAWALALDTDGTSFWASWGEYLLRVDIANGEILSETQTDPGDVVCHARCTRGCPRSLRTHLSCGCNPPNGLYAAS